jgi:amino-acid N-acetyltransferase
MTRTLVPTSTSTPPATAVRREGEVRRATADDVQAMKALIDTFARRNRMLFRSAAELAEFVAEYQVYVEADAIRGVCGLHPVAGGLAEVRGLAVAEDAAGQGIGRRLVSACVDRARALGISKVYTLTLVPEFFEKLRFYQVDKGTLHLKVWYECYRCPKFANCDEIAMVRPLDLE